MRPWIVLAACGVLACSSPAPAPRRPVDGARIERADLEPGSWLSHGRDYGEQRYSPLKQIHAGNVGDLGLAWAFDLRTRRGLEATSLVVDGVLYTTATWSVVVALDAATGELLWRYEPHVDRRHASKTCCGVVNRGVAAWEGKVFVGTLDGRLIALDSKTGEPVWSVMTVDPDRPYAITGAPRVVKGKVVIGNGGADMGARGYVSAYAADDGKLVWRFYTVPRNPSEPQESPALERALKSWPRDSGPNSPWWEVGGGGTVWDSIAFDPELDLLYVGTGNGAPWARHVRSPGGGDNLYLSSILALRPDTGELVWHYQVTPGDSWDFTATQHMILADLEIGGRLRKVLMQAPKNGFFYVLDRETGELLSANAFAKVTWAERVDLESGRPVEVPGVDFADAPVSIYPGSLGAHNWQPMAFHPGTGLVYIPAQEVPGYYAPIEKPLVYVAGGSFANAGVDFTEATTFPREAQKGSLDAWDPVAGRRVWRVAYETISNGGLVATAGNLVFQGTADGRFVAYAADTGAKLWEARAPTAIIASPVTYEVDGVQYVSVLAGWGGAFGLTGGDAARAAGVAPAGWVLSYRLGGTAPAPDSPPTHTHRPPPAPPPGSEALVEQGSDLFAINCSACHGIGAVGTGLLHDLRFMRPGARRSFENIVLRGSLQRRGMPAFGNVIDARGAEALLLYLADRAHAAR